MRGALQAWVLVAAWVALAAAVLGGREVLRRPRLDVELSLRGSTRAGTLYVRVHNRGRRAARGVRVKVAWVGAQRSEAVEEAEVGEIEGRSAAALTVRDLHRGATGPWTALRVEASAANAWRARRLLALGPRETGPAPTAPPPVEYRSARSAPCPGSPDGAHLDRVTRVLNDGVQETWHVCARCRHVWREPLTPAEEATQASVRRARAERERQKLEEEFERMQREEPRVRRGPAREAEDTMPATVAFWILGLDESRATWPDVVAAHRRLALENHPDRAGLGAAERMADINRARDRLREHFRPERP